MSSSNLQHLKIPEVCSVLSNTSSNTVYGYTAFAGQGLSDALKLCVIVLVDTIELQG